MRKEVKDLFLIKDPTRMRFEKCLGVTGSEIFLVNLISGGALIFSKNFEELIKLAYRNERAAKGEEIEIDRFEYASSHLQEIVQSDS